MEELFDTTMGMSEECLHLAVSTPYDPSDGKCLFRFVPANEFFCSKLSVVGDLPADLPVMFWVHGGSFVYGLGEIGNDLARFGDVADVIVVAINYRLGPLGEI